MPGYEFNFEHEWATLDNRSTWQLISGRFSSSNRHDIAAYNPSDGVIKLGANTGSGFVLRDWASVTPPDEWHFLAADFDAEGPADLIGYRKSDGTLWVGEPRAEGLSLHQWGMVAPARGWRFAAADFTGDKRADLIGYHPSRGELWLGRNTGAGFAFERFGVVSPSTDWQFVAADFTGDGRADVAGYHPSNGTVWLGSNIGSALAFTQWAKLDPASRWHFAAGHFDGDKRSDLFAYDSTNGTLHVGVNSGAAFLFDYRGLVSPRGGWQFATGRFSGANSLEVVCYDPISGTVWVGTASARPFEGYCWPLSVQPGEDVEVMLSGGGTASVTIARCRSASIAVETLPVLTDTVAIETQPIAANPWRDGCGWKPSLKFSVPPSCESGIYTVRCTDAMGARIDLPLVVRPKPDRRSRLAVLANVNTWLAYNDWGGGSKYSGLAHGSFLRPNPVASPTAPVGGAGHLTRGELWVLGWLEAAGYKPDLYSDIDFDRDGCDASQYRCLILSTHPEYWTVRMYDRLLDYLNAGGSAAYLGGNGVFEVAEYDGDATGMTFVGGVTDGVREAHFFRTVSPPRAERSVLGVATSRCNVPGSPYLVEAAHHPLFAGTGLNKGDPFGESGLNRFGPANGQASGLEVDSRDGPWATGIPHGCKLSNYPVPTSSLPAGLTLLAHGKDDVIGPGADMICYDHPGGGIVFSVGSVTFGGSLVVDAKIQQILRNVLSRAGVS